MTDDSDPIQIRVDPLITDLVGPYLQRLRTEIPQMRESLAEGDVSKLRTFGHNLAGTGGAFELHDFSTVGAQIEELVLRGKLAEVAPLLEQLENWLSRVEVVIGDG